MYISIPVSSTSGWVYFSLCMLFDALAISSSNTKKDTVYSLNYKGIQQKAGGGCCTVFIVVTARGHYHITIGLQAHWTYGCES